MKTSYFFTNFKIIFTIYFESQKDDEVLKDIIFTLVANGLAQEVKHSQIEVIFFNFSISDFKVVKEGDNHALDFSVVVEIEMVGICVDKGDDPA